MPDDGLPNIICNQCKEHLSFVFDFKERCIRVNDTLRELMHGQNVPQVKKEEDPLQIFACNECDYQTTVYNDYCDHCTIHESKKDLIELNFVPPPIQSPSLTNSTTNYYEISKFEKESMDSSITDRTSSNENTTLPKPRKSRVRNKESFAHSSETPFPCISCDQKFSSRDDLTYHLLRKHSAQASTKPYKCTYDNCKMSYDFLSHLVNHIYRHMKITPYKCDICQKEYSDCTKLKIHASVHTGERPISCHLCKSKFRLKQHLKKHLASKHKDRLDKTQMKKKSYKCKYVNCKKVFESPNHLNIHYRYHKELDEQKSEESCEGTNANSTQLKSDLLEDPSKRPYSCDYCDGKFKMKHHLKQHVIAKHKEATEKNQN